ncbi:geranylgeranyl reductase family protein [Curtobacterium sp. MCBD17_030]|uniref:geranylgeranyl reductase family protein n=1 Tax=Curtobacterium sp. MCBD17_030 TaxID=2175649 RepID=UPI000D9CB411|nr:geranylgeranyl reductase family protein [Curtobacterium sp. MCBD17_030]PYY31747.1 hyaluronate lyase [Curtobacterium sp. MCBD17_030]
MQDTESDQPWDVVVVGAGPAGATAARHAALGGARVLLLDKAVFPRYKTCGGGIIGQSRRRLNDRALATIEADLPEVGFSHRMGRVTRVRTEVPFVAMVDRERFDQANVDAAQEAGVVFRDGANVRALADEDGRTRLTLSDGDELVARVVIGADGSGGRVGRYVGAVMAVTDLGLEVEVPRRPEDAATGVLLDWGPHPGTYAWVFPKAETLTVGVIEQKGHADQTRRYLDDWIERLGLHPTDQDRSSGHLTQWRTGDSPLRSGTVLLAGETAGLLEPWTREGISFALRSGEWAGTAAAAHVAGDRAALDRYESQVRAELVPEIDAGAQLLRVFTRFPAGFHFLISKTPFGRGYFVRFCRGETTLARAFRHRWVRKVTGWLG